MGHSPPAFVPSRSRLGWTRIGVLLAALLLTAAACGPRAPDGVSVAVLDENDRDLRHDAAHRRVLLARGRYPEKTFAGALDLSTGKTRAHRSSGRMIMGGPSPRSVSGRGLWSAAEIVDDYAGEQARGQIVLDAEPGAPSADLALPLPEGRAITCLAEPAWGDGVLVVSSRAEGKKTTAGWWRRGGAALESATPLPDGASACLPSSRSPRLGLVIADKGAARFAVWDLVAKREASSVPLASAPGLVGAGEEGTAFVRVENGDEDDHALLSLDPDTGRATEIFASSIPVASAAAAPGAVFLLLRDEKAQSGASRLLKPQELVKLDSAGRVDWRRSWSRLPSSLVGFDRETGRLLIAVQDPWYSALWSVPAEPDAISVSAAQVERASNPARRRAGMALKVLVGAAFLFALIFGLLNAA